LSGNRVEVALGDRRQIQPLGKILADQAIGILVGRPLPGAVRVGKIDVDLDALGENLVAGHLPALIVSQRLFHGVTDRHNRATSDRHIGASLNRF